MNDFELTVSDLQTLPVQLWIDKFWNVARRRWKETIFSPADVTQSEIHNEIKTQYVFFTKKQKSSQTSDGINKIKDYGY